MAAQFMKLSLQIFHFPHSFPKFARQHMKPFETIGGLRFCEDPADVILEFLRDLL